MFGRQIRMKTSLKYLTIRYKAHRFTPTFLAVVQKALEHVRQQNVKLQTDVQTM